MMERGISRIRQKMKGARIKQLVQMNKETEYTKE